MHELTLCVQIIRTLEEEAQKRKFNRVSAVWLDVGDLAAIDVGALEFSFPIAARNSVADEATLHIVTVPGRAWCHDCEALVDIAALFKPCPQCGNYHYDVREGTTLRISKMEAN